MPAAAMVRLRFVRPDGAAGVFPDLHHPAIAGTPLTSAPFMRVNEVPYFVGLTAAERREIVLEAARIQNDEIRGIVGDLFNGSRQAATGVTGPLTDFAQQLSRNTLRPAGPLEFARNQERQRQATPQTTQRRPGIGAIGGQSPLDFARRGGVAGLPGNSVSGRGPALASARIGVPPPPPLRTFPLAQVLQPQVDETMRVIGRLIDVIA